MKWSLISVRLESGFPPRCAWPPRSLSPHSASPRRGAFAHVPSTLTSYLFPSFVWHDFSPRRNPTGERGSNKMAQKKAMVVGVGEGGFSTKLDQKLSNHRHHRPVRVLFCWLALRRFRLPARKFDCNRFNFSASHNASRWRWSLCRQAFIYPRSAFNLPVPLHSSGTEMPTAGELMRYVCVCVRWSNASGALIYIQTFGNRWAILWICVNESNGKEMEYRIPEWELGFWGYYFD